MYACCHGVGAASCEGGGHLREGGPPLTVSPCSRLILGRVVHVGGFCMSACYPQCSLQCLVFLEGGAQLNCLSKSCPPQTLPQEEPNLALGRRARRCRRMDQESLECGTATIIPSLSSSS